MMYGINDKDKKMQNTENDNSVTSMKLQKGLGIIRKRKQEAILYKEGTKVMKNQKNIIIQNCFCIIHGVIRMTSYHHLQLITCHTSVSKI